MEREARDDGRTVTDERTDAAGSVVVEAGTQYDGVIDGRHTQVAVNDHLELVTSGRHVNRALEFDHVGHVTGDLPLLCAG